MTTKKKNIELEEVCSELDVVETSTLAIDKQLGGKLAGLSLTKQVLLLAIWPFLENFLGFLVGFVDMAISGRFPTEAMTENASSAVGVGGYLNWGMFLIQGSVSIGTVALVSRATGARHRSLANAAVGQSMILGVLASILTGATVAIFAGDIVTLFFDKLTPEAKGFATNYLRITALALPFSGVMTVGNASLRASGDTRTPFFAMVIVNIVNAVMSMLFVFGPEGLGGHKVSGIAMGTVSGWLVGTAIILVVLIRGKGAVKLRLLRLRPHWHTIKRLLKVGIPGGAESLGLWLIHFSMLIAIGKLGDNIVGVHMVTIRLEAVSYMGGFAMATAAATLVGMYLGLGDPQKARQATRLCCFVASGAMGIWGLAFFFIPETLISIMNSGSLYLEKIPPILKLSASIQIFYGARMVLMGAMRGAGDTKYTLFVTWVSSIFVRLGGILLLFNVLGPFLGIEPTLFRIWVIICLDQTVQFFLILPRFKSSKWLEVKV